ncbi:MAG: hypothetical protein LKF33_06260 [Prevotella sp.]|jgi:hypothetical protein|nr:hypothetical protein [Prevotella sp.]
MKHVNDCKNENDYLNHDPTFPYLTYDHPLAKKLLFEKIKKYNRKAKKWGYETRIEYNVKYRTAVPSPLITYRIDPNGGFFKNFKNGYRNKYLDDLGCQIIVEVTNLRLKIPLWKRYWLFVSLWLNYP